MTISNEKDSDVVWFISCVIPDTPDMDDTVFIPFPFPEDMLDEVLRVWVTPRKIFASRKVFASPHDHEGDDDVDVVD